ncbi:MAG: hybrid sensor histidine kinase/response regulator [Opitutaceae bacterium]|jgi:signal transduction histidine kinase
MKHILIIDDDKDLLAVLSSALELEGYEVQTATSGQEGLRRAYEWLPNLILCDIMMPDMEGTTVLQALRVDASTADSQIVLMTGVNTGNEARRQGMDLGADDFLAKPFSILELSNCVKARLQRAELNKRVEPQFYDSLRKAMHSTLPHEFFTPLAGILGLSQLLRSDLDEIPRDEARAMILDIEHSASRLHRTLSNYLKLLELESATIAPSPVPLHPETALQIVSESAATTAERRGRTGDLILDCKPLPLPISEENLSTIVDELVDNACAYSRRDTPVTLQMRREGDIFTISVSDSGRGMSPTQVERIGSFQQFDRQQYEQQGLGLGLALVRGLAQTHGGNLLVSSAPGQGTHCLLQWPASAAPVGIPAAALPKA